MILAANRDEQHSRASDPASWWADEIDVLGGRDLRAGGSWLAVDRRGRLAAVTNFIDPGSQPAPKSRGMLVRDYLSGTASIEAFSEQLVSEGDDYGAFNLLLFDGDELGYVSNRDGARRLAAGIHSISNSHLDVDWPKTRRASLRVDAALASVDPTEELFGLLAERTVTRSGHTPHERSLFIVGPQYGTRSSTVVLIERNSVLRFVERRFDANGRMAGQDRFDFELRSESFAGRRVS